MLYRRGFMFGAGATIAIASADVLMKVRPPKIILALDIASGPDETMFWLGDQGFYRATHAGLEIFRPDPNAIWASAPSRRIS